MAEAIPPELTKLSPRSAVGHLEKEKYVPGYVEQCEQARFLPYSLLSVLFDFTKLSRRFSNGSVEETTKRTRKDNGRCDSRYHSSIRTLH